MDNIIRSLPTPILVLNPQLQVVEVSREALVLFNLRFYPDDWQRNRSCVETWLAAKPELHDLLSAAVARVTKSGAAEKIQWQDSARFLRLTVVAEPSGELFLVSFEDYTEQFAMEHSNAQARSYLESIMSSLYLGIIVTDRDLMVTNLNRTQVHFLQRANHGISLLQAVGMHLDELLPDEVELLEKIRKEVLTDGMVCGGIVERVEEPAGEECVFNVSFFPLRDEHNAIVGIIRVCEDVTEKLALEAELRQAEVQALEIEAIRKVIITLNHEINNSLMVVVGNAEVILRTTPELTADHRDMLQNILTQAEKINSVTQQLLSMQVVKTDAYLPDGPQMIVTDHPPEKPG